MNRNHVHGDKKNATNYRPVTINSCLGKLFSLLLNERISSFLERNNIISNVQIGFLKSHCTADHLFLLKSLVDLYKQRKKHIYACFVDFSSAFNNVWHAGLLYKLHHCGISSKVVRLLHNMYSKLHTCIKKGQNISKYFLCNIGTRQGCNMSPAVFKIYLNDLQEIFNEKKCYPLGTGVGNIGCLMYADDVVIL